MNLTIKDLPVSERPREKLIKYGAENLSEAELLSIILRVGTRKERVTEVANKILNYYDPKEGITTLLRISIDELVGIHGIGIAKAVQVKAIAELSLRLHQAIKKEKISILDSKSVFEYYKYELRHKKEEVFIALYLDVKLNIITEKRIGGGFIDRVDISPREVFREAILKGAKSIILIHNHVSGDSTPSDNDIVLTERLIECGLYLGIHVIDHIIIGDNNYKSLKEGLVVNFI